MYIYLSNESNSANYVYFDNLSVTVNESRILEKSDYYPFGLTFNGYEKAGMLDQRYKFNQGTGKTKFKTERVTDLGMNLDMTRYRMYDYSLGRFMQSDPKADVAGQETWTPYHYSFNSPIRYNDPYGDCPPWVCGGINKILDKVQGALDVAGLVPGVGIAADLANAGISAGRGDKLGVALSLAAAAPIVGIAAGVAKTAKNANKIVGGANKVKKVSLDNNALIAAVEGGEKTAVKKAIGNADQITVSTQAAKEFMNKGSKQELKGFMSEIGAKMSKNGASTSQVKKLQGQASDMGRSLKGADGKVAADAINNNATLITRDKKLQKFMNASGNSSKGF